MPLTSVSNTEQYFGVLECNTYNGVTVTVDKLDTVYIPVVDGAVDTVSVVNKVHGVGSGTVVVVIAVVFNGGFIGADAHIRYPLVLTSCI